MIRLSDQPIDASLLLAEVQNPAAGAAVLFTGMTRQFTHGRETVELRYDAYREMAQRELEKLVAEAKERWPLTGCAVVHRLGHAPIGAVSVAIAVSSPHRGDAFRRGRVAH